MSAAYSRRGETIPAQFQSGPRRAPTPAEMRKAALYTASRARGAADLAELLDALGIHTKTNRGN